MKVRLCMSSSLQKKELIYASYICKLCIFHGKLAYLDLIILPMYHIYNTHRNVSIP